MHFIDFNSVRFADPRYLWLLAVPCVLLLLWAWRLARYRDDAANFGRRRYLPVRERIPLFGGLLFWLSALFASALAVVAVARPVVLTSAVQTSGIDLIRLQEGSASMHVSDVAGDRWQRSMQFERVLADSLQWKSDRVALAVFSHIAAPQVRLTKDPNTFLFFLDHLDKESPFRLQDDTTWDTNIEQGIHWGMRLFDKDRELHGRSPNAPVFVLISDGQAWSGRVETAIKEAHERGIPIYVVGVGTSGGGMIPAPPVEAGAPPPAPYIPIHATLDRGSLIAIANAGTGEYMELDRETDREIANRIIDVTRRRANSHSTEQSAQDIYWPCLLAAAFCLGAGVFVSQEQSELWLQGVAASAVLAALWMLTH